ncbi:MAG: hypothetical protein M0T84_02380 [Betaproteobacteria bacterium]|nr:hypothetical protein [Betaproteobacteria bacterium]
MPPCPQTPCLATRLIRPVRLRACASAVVLALGLGATHARADAPPAVECPAAPMPAGMTQSLVAPQAAINGMPMRIAQIDDKSPPSDVLAWYQRRWTLAGGRPDYVQYPLGAWQVIARKMGSCFYTVQVQSSSTGTTGFIGVSVPTQGAALAARPGFPALGGSHTLLDLESKDTGKGAHTWLFVNDSSMNENAHFYLQTLRGLGWREQMAQTLQTSRGIAATLTFQKGNRTAQIVVRPAVRGTVVLATEVTHG